MGFSEKAGSPHGGKIVPAAQRYVDRRSTGAVVRKAIKPPAIRIAVIATHKLDFVTDHDVEHAAELVLNLEHAQNIVWTHSEVVPKRPAHRLRVKELSKSIPAHGNRSGPEDTVYSAGGLVGACSATAFGQPVGAQSEEEGITVGTERSSACAGAEAPTEKSELSFLPVP